MIIKIMCNSCISLYNVLLLLLFMLLPQWQFSYSYASNFDWSLVKPMHLVSLYPPPPPLHKDHVGNSENPLQHQHDSYYNEDKLDSMDDSMSPLVVNMETEAVLNDNYNNYDDDNDDGVFSNDMTNVGRDAAMDRIFGGNTAHTNCFPYQVGLLLQRPKGLYWCGGSLISDAFVLTAAHCVDMAKRALVFLGANEIKNAKETGQIRLMVHRDNFIIFPTWNPRRLKDDIALIRLPEPIEFNDRIYPIQLPRRSYEYRTFKNKLAIASGWGRYSSGVRAISGVLRFVKLQIINGQTCKRTFPLSYRSTNICTSGNDAKSTCSGDSGGPLVLRRKNSKKRVLVGITSFGSIFGCDRGYPAAFTKVAAYLDWISDEAGVEPLEETSNAMFFSRYLQDYKKKINHHHNHMAIPELNSSMTDNDSSLHQGYNHHPPDAQIFHNEHKDKTSNSNLDYSLFIL